MNRITVQRLYADLRDALDLTPLTPLPGDDIPVPVRDVHRPGMALMGFAENFLPHRLQVMGESELAYLAGLSADRQIVAFGQRARSPGPRRFRRPRTGAAGAAARPGAGAGGADPAHFAGLGGFHR